MSLLHLAKISYWFAVTTPPFQKISLVIALLVLAACFIAGMVLRIYARRAPSNPPLARGFFRLARPLFFVSILGFILVAFRQMGAAVLSARGWTLLVFLIALMWLVFVARSVHKTYASEYNRLQETRKYQAYLPKKKK